MIPPIETRIFTTRHRLYATDIGLSQSATEVPRLLSVDGFPNVAKQPRVCLRPVGQLTAVVALSSQKHSCLHVFVSFPELRQLLAKCRECLRWDALLNEGLLLDADRRMNSITGRVLAIPAASVTNSGASASRALHVELTSQQVNANPMSFRCHHTHSGELGKTWTGLPYCVMYQFVTAARRSTAGLAGQLASSCQLAVSQPVGNKWKCV